MHTCMNAFKDTWRDRWSWMQPWCWVQPLGGQLWLSGTDTWIYHKLETKLRSLVSLDLTIISTNLKHNAFVICHCVLYAGPHTSGLTSTCVHVETTVFRMEVHTHEWAHIHMCTCGHQRTTLGLGSQLLINFGFCFALAWSWPSRLGWLTSKLSGSWPLPPQCQGYKPDLLWWCWALNSGPHACTENTLYSLSHLPSPKTSYF